MLLSYILYYFVGITSKKWPDDYSTFGHNRYDINYIEESMGWSRPLHGIGGSHDIPSSGSMTTQGDMNKGMSMDSSPASSGMLRKRISNS